MAQGIEEGQAMARWSLLNNEMKISKFLLTKLFYFFLIQSIIIIFLILIEMETLWSVLA